MKNEKNEKINYRDLNEVIDLSKKMLKIFYACLIIGIILFVYLFLKELKIMPFIGTVISVATPFFIGLVIAWILDPIVTWLQEKNVKRTVGAIIVFCVFMIVLYLLFRLIVPMLYKQLLDFVNTLPSLFVSIANFITNLFSKIEGSGMDLTSVEESIVSQMENLSVSLTTNLPTKALEFISSFVSSIGTFFIGLLAGFYLLIDFDSAKHILDVIPRKYHKDILGITEKLNTAFKKFIQGTLLISLIVAFLSTIGYGAIGLTTPLLFGFICGFTNIIPYIGPWIGGAICVIVGFTISPMVGILAGVVAFVIQQIDNVILNPVVMGRTMKLHPVTIMIGLLIFGYFFGIIGMILATPIMAGIKIIINYFDEKYEFMNKIKRNTKEEKVKEEQKLI